MDKLGFYIDGLETVVLMGANPQIDNLIKIHDGLGIKTLVVTSPDQEQQILNGHKLVTEKLDDGFANFINEHVKAKKTLFVSLGARWIFKSNIIHDICCGNIVNFHGSRLPFDAGGGGFSWRILKNDRINNLLVHCVDEGIDTGDILDYKTNIFPSFCKIPLDYMQHYQDTFLEFYKNFVSKLKVGENFHRSRQTNFNGNYYPRLNTKKHAWIDWSMKDHDLYRFINAFDDPYDGAGTFLNGQEVRLKSVHLHGGEQGGHPFMAGLIIRHDQNWLTVQTAGKECLLIEKINDGEGKNIISKIKMGDRFYTPQNYLDNAISSRVSYTSKGLKA